MNKRNLGYKVEDRSINEKEYFFLFWKKTKLLLLTIVTITNCTKKWVSNCSLLKKPILKIGLLLKKDHIVKTTHLIRLWCFSKITTLPPFSKEYQISPRRVSSIRVRNLYSLFLFIKNWCFWNLLFSCKKYFVKFSFGIPL